MALIPSQSSYLRTILNFPLVEESPAASLPQEFGIILYTRYTFEFHNTTDLEHLREPEPIPETDIFSFGHSLPERSFSVPSLVVALDHLVECTGLKSLQVGLENRVHRQLIDQTVLDEVEGRNPDKYSYEEKELQKFGRAEAL